APVLRVDPRDLVVGVLPVARRPRAARRQSYRPLGAASQWRRGNPARSRADLQRLPPPRAPLGPRYRAALFRGPPCPYRGLPEDAGGDARRISTLRSGDLSGRGGT